MQQKRGTAAQWAVSTYVLLAGEIGFETDTNRIKIGNETDLWSALDYLEDTVDETLAYGNNSESLIFIENATIIDTVVSSQWRSLKYVISMAKTSGGANKFEVTEITILIDGFNVNVSEYGSIDNNGEVGTISVSQNGGNVEITAIPKLTVTPITVRYYRTGLKA